jgi:mRNA interferase MazF
MPPPIGRRPVMLLSRDSAYEVLNKVIAVEVTTRIRGIPQEVSLGRREGLDRACVANFDNLHVIHKRELDERIGAIARTRVPELKRALGHALGWPELVL